MTIACRTNVLKRKDGENMMKCLTNAENSKCSESTALTNEEASKRLAAFIVKNGVSKDVFLAALASLFAIDVS